MKFKFLLSILIQFSNEKPIFREYRHHTKSPASKSTFERICREKKIGVHHPKKDNCDFCTKTQLEGSIQVTQTEHFKEQAEALAEKAELKIQISEDSSREAFCMDLESALPCPKLNCRAFFYRTKLQFHNLTTWNLKTKAVDCYTYDETNAGHDPCVFASITLKHLTWIKQQNPNVSEIIIYSDNCCFQNKNALLSNVIIDFCLKQKITVQHRYLVVGHTHMECDSYHSCVERATRHVEVYTPNDYVCAMVTARKLKKVVDYDTQVHKMTFKDFKKFQLSYMKSIRPGSKKGDPTVADVRAYRYLPSGKMEFKLKVREEFRPVPFAIRIKEIPEPGPLYSKPLVIKPEKKRHLLELLPCMPPAKRGFFERLLDVHIE